MIPEAAVEAAAEAVYGHQIDEGVREATKARLLLALEAAAPHIAAQALEGVAAAMLTNDPLDFWAMHTPEGAGHQEAMSLWLKAHARAKMSQTPYDFVTPRG